MNIPQTFQLVNGLIYFVSVLVILRHVQKATISDKYGVLEIGLLAALSYINISYNWFLVMSWGAGLLILIAGIGFAVVGIFFSAQLTEYSRARRAAIQELALLRHRYQTMVSKNEIIREVQVPQVH